MRLFSAALLYLSATLGANADPTALADLRAGDMVKLAIHDTPRAVSETAFLTESGEERSLAEYRGKVIAVNFWATWCPPCRTEMPHLSALQTALGGDEFEVVTIATGRNPPEAMAAFFSEIGAQNLPLHRDPRQAVARDMAVLGLPVTVLIDRDGQEVARLQGDADWAGESAQAIISALIAGS